MTISGGPNCDHPVTSMEPLEGTPFGVSGQAPTPQEKSRNGFGLLVEHHPDRVRMGTWHEGHIHWRTAQRLQGAGLADIEYELGVGWVSLTDKGLAAVEDFLDAQLVRGRDASDTGERMTLEELVEAQGYDLEEFGLA